MNTVLSQLTFLILIFSIISNDIFEVEARHKEVIPVPGWFNSVEGFVIPSSDKLRPRESKKLFVPFDSGELDEENKPKRKNKKKKMKKIGKKCHHEATKASEEKKETKQHKKKRRKLKGKKLKFLKTTVNNDYSTLSVSKETKDEWKKKPVDITVHIKMDD